VLVSLLLIIAIVVVVSSSVSSSADCWDGQAQQATITVAEPLIAAINQYNQDHQLLPKSLDALIPKYIDVLPTPAVGSHQWAYQVTKHGYELYVQSSNPEPPSLISSLIFGRGDFDDRYFRYSDVRKVWEMADW